MRPLGTFDRLVDVGVLVAGVVLATLAVRDSDALLAAIGGVWVGLAIATVLVRRLLP